MLKEKFGCSKKNLDAPKKNLDAQRKIWNKLCFGRGPIWHREGYYPSKLYLLNIFLFAVRTLDNTQWVYTLTVLVVAAPAGYRVKRCPTHQPTNWSRPLSTTMCPTYQPNPPPNPPTGLLHNQPQWNRAEHWSGGQKYCQKLCRNPVDHLREIQ